MKPTAALLLIVLVAVSQAEETQEVKASRPPTNASVKGKAMSVDKPDSVPLSDIERIVATEDIRQLKARYWAAVDTKRWDDVLEMFASPDAKIELPMKFPDGRPITTAKEFVTRRRPAAGA